MRGLGGRAARALYVHRRGISDTRSRESLGVIGVGGDLPHGDPEFDLFNCVLGY